MDGVEPDDERFDAGPLPPHERVWRHPSEMGQITWQRSEPPLTIGRGLLFTTGAIGGLLALAVLWTTLPTGAGSSVAVVSTQVARPAHVVTLPASSGLVNSVTPAGGPLAGRDETPAQSPRPGTSDAPAAVSFSDGPPNTLHVSGASVERSAVAVLVGATAVVITTAGSIDPDDVVTLTSRDGATKTAKVMLIYRGVAVLEPDSDVGSTTLALGDPTHAGDTVVVFGSAAVAVPIGLRSDGNVQIDRWGDSDAPEGAPVINREGQLVGLCRHAKNGPEMVVVDADALRSMVTAATSEPKDGSRSTSTAVVTTVVAVPTSTSTGSPPPVAGSVPTSAASASSPATNATSAAPATSLAPSSPATTNHTTTTALSSSSSTAAPPGSPRTGGWLGIQLEAHATSATIVRLEVDGPADLAGLRVGDTILTVDATATLTAADLASLLAGRLPGDKVRLTVRRFDVPDSSSPSISVSTLTTVSVVVTLASPPTAT